MHDNTYIQTVAKALSRNRDREPLISGTFVRLNELDSALPDVLLEKLFISGKKTFCTKNNLIFTKVPTF